MFDFGTNWRRYSQRVLDETHLAAIQSSLEELVGIGALEGRSLLDVGCGSGVFAIAACRMGAGRVVGIDVSESGLEAARLNSRRFLNLTTSRPEFLLISVLDRDHFPALGTFDVVYAWGSLHHTGALWDAVDATAARVRPGGTLVLAIYRTHASSPVWWYVKWVCARLPRPILHGLAWLVLPAIAIAKGIVTRRNPFRKKRGMDFYIDVVDWLGGFPYEYAHAGDVEQRVAALGFEHLRTIPPDAPTGCNQFVFRRVQ